MRKILFTIISCIGIVSIIIINIRKYYIDGKGHLTIKCTESPHLKEWDG